jgi:uncharacterized short protein YbdD (DUF466 family)
MELVSTSKEVKAGPGAIPAFSTRLRRIARRFWRGLREWCGDAAYESYLCSNGRNASSCPTLTPAEFYVEQLNRRYSRPNRCC